MKGQTPNRDPSPLHRPVPQKEGKAETTAITARTQHSTIRVNCLIVGTTDNRPKSTLCNRLLSIKRNVTLPVQPTPFSDDLSRSDSPAHRYMGADAGSLHNSPETNVAVKQTAEMENRTEGPCMRSKETRKTHTVIHHHRFPSFSGTSSRLP